MIRRAPRGEPRFVKIPNTTARDRRLSFRARGLLTFMLSQPDNWTTTSEELAEQATEGRDAIRTALRELETAGYLVRRRYQNERGHWVTEAVVDAHPMTGNTSPASPAETDESAAHAEDGNPVVGAPVANKKTDLEDVEEQQRSTDESVGTPQLTLISDTDTLNAEFEDWWGAYANGLRKLRKAKARAAFRAAVKRLGGWRKAEPVLVEGTRRWNKHWRDGQTAPQHIPHPTTWLTNQDYLDMPPTLDTRRARTR